MTLRIGQSLIPNAGRGVFATKNYDCGDYVCSYHIHETSADLPVDKTYALQVSDGWITGDPTNENLETCAHLINDGASSNMQIGSADGTDHEASIEEIEEIIRYEKLSLNRQNVVSIDNVFYACKRIKSGEELYFRYGCRYWTAFETHDIFLGSATSLTEQEKMSTELNKVIQKKQGLDLVISIFKWRKKYINKY